MSKLRTIIRLHRDQQDLKAISKLCGISRNTVKKYLAKWRTLNISYEEFQAKSDVELHELFWVEEGPSAPNPRLEELESLLSQICKELGRRGMTTLKQWDKYIAEHQRDRTAYRYTTNPEHQCPQHKAIMEWAPEKFISQAAAIHEDVEHYIWKILAKTPYIDQAHKYCSGILNFARKVGADRLASACRLADSYGRYSFMEIQDILKNQSEGIDFFEEEPVDMPEHENIRRRDYYK